MVGLCRIVESEHENRLQAIYVLPEYQGKGIGKMLWQSVQKIFNPNKDIFVGVAVYNENAISFYNKLGFIDTDNRYSDERFRMKSGSMIPEMDMVIRKK